MIWLQNETGQTNFVTKIPCHVNFVTKWICVYNFVTKESFEWSLWQNEASFYGIRRGTLGAPYSRACHKTLWVCDPVINEVVRHDSQEGRFWYPVSMVMTTLGRFDTLCQYSWSAKSYPVQRHVPITFNNGGPPPPPGKGIYMYDIRYLAPVGGGGVLAV